MYLQDGLLAGWIVWVVRCALTFLFDSPNTKPNPAVAAQNTKPNPNCKFILMGFAVVVVMLVVVVIVKVS